MIDTLFKDIESIESKCNSILEIGVGSSFVINNLKAILDSRGWIGHCMATDVNIQACEYSSRVSKEFKTATDLLLADAAGPFKSACMDMVICNPPYVVTLEDEVIKVKDAKAQQHKVLKDIHERQKLIQHNTMEDCKEGIDVFKEVRDKSNTVECAWVGGDVGLEFFDRIIGEAYRVLRPGGIFYFLVIEDNQPEEIVQYCEDIGFTNTKFLSSRIKLNEKIYILKMEKKNDEA